MYFSLFYFLILICRNTFLVHALGRSEMHTKFWLDELQVRGHLEDKDR